MIQQNWRFRSYLGLLETELGRDSEPGVGSTIVTTSLPSVGKKQSGTSVGDWKKELDTL